MSLVYMYVYQWNCKKTTILIVIRNIMIKDDNQRFAHFYK